MRVMMFVKATKDSEAGVLPGEQLLSDMMKFNEELTKAGVLLDLGGFKPSMKAARVRLSGAQRTVLDGPFAETKELVAGFWLLQVKSLEEAVEWAKRCPSPHPDQDACEIEIRPLFDLSDFPEANAETLATANEIGQELDRGRKQAGR